jgi:magnesium-transporting ATPase (P-type)
MEFDIPWHTRKVSELVEHFALRDLNHGHDSSNIPTLQRIHGPNKLPEAARPGFCSYFASSIPLIFCLAVITATFLAFVAKHESKMSVILHVLVIGCVLLYPMYLALTRRESTYDAAQTEAMKNYSTVIRDGRQ